MSIRLSEAIRLGAMLGPQLFNGTVFDCNGGSCAIGAACMATGKHKCKEDWIHGAFFRLYPGIARSTWEDIIRLNNVERWTLEQIADWLVESGNDCESAETVPAQEIAAALISQHMVAR